MPRFSVMVAALQPHGPHLSASLVSVRIGRAAAQFISAWLLGPLATAMWREELAFGRAHP